ncbi:VOC family protein [Candidatus Thioglobus autotrophicus]|uniref:VOC family protein n=1 Tax=Candidatus Thioglobus autotrophicus TaxID=1705394 RepID=UPI00299F2732|nr:VOC family protein [Candidatus Thioglobus autotrophicus]WPE17739.1 glyoxalase [Candidatus Thioglobus autotrophicus]
MRDSRNVFHLAVPCIDLDEAYDFYVTGLGCKLARRYKDRITVDFFGDQLVCHKYPEKTTKDSELEMYPRHAGITFYDKNHFDDLIALVGSRKLKYYEKPFVRFEGAAEEHHSFFLIDPSNNLLEFKYYKDSRMMY